jgi:DNA-binding transcriptional regulator YhcF (GntR family)
MSLLSNIKSEQKLLKELNETLSILPQVKLLKFDVQSAEGSDSGVDAKAEIETKNKKKIEILVQCKASGYPRDLERVVKQLKEYKQKSAETIALIVSQAISPGARKLLQDEGIGYFDAGGSLYLPFSDGIYFIDRPAPALERKLQNIYEGKSSQVLHILLSNPEREWHVTELAEEAEVSPYTVHHVFTNLEKQSIVERHGKGPESVRILKKARDLLNAWEENYSYKHYKFLNFYKWSQSTDSLRDEIAETLESRKINYALTLASGAQLVAPFITGSEKLYFIVEESMELDDAIGAAGLEPVEDGALVTFMTTRSRAPLLNRQKIRDLYVASDVQLYLDLSKWKARGREQAEHLRWERLKF